MEGLLALVSPPSILHDTIDSRASPHTHSPGAISLRSQSVLAEYRRQPHLYTYVFDGSLL